MTNEVKPKKTLQDLFNVAFLGLKAQGFKKSVGLNGCMYRGEGGLKCAIGHALSDEDYAMFTSIALPTRLVHGVENAKASLVAFVAPSLLEYDIGLDEYRENYRMSKIWDELQYCHDEGYRHNSSNMESNLRKFAAKHMLTVPK